MPNGLVLDLPMLTPEDAPPKAAALLRAAKEKIGFVPNMYGYMAQVPELLEAYLGAYAGFREGAGFTPPEQEVVFLAISLENGCDYCAAAHSMLALKMSKVPAASVAALREGRPLPDARLEALADFTRLMVTSRGTPQPAAVQAFLDAGFTERHVLGIILAIGVKTYSNYTNHLAGTTLDPAFAEHAVPASG